MAETSLALDLTAFAQAYRERADRAIRELMIRLGTNVVYRSPVKTGHFRGNWQLGIGVAPTSELKVTDAAGSETVSKITAAIPEDAGGKVYYLRNNVPYGPRLEEGWSAQAPAGIVGLAVAEFQTYVDEAVRSAR
jgi:hypothetical protein